MRRAFLGLGSNLGDRRAHLATAVDTLSGDVEGDLGVVAVSRTYETAPVGGPPQGAYLNLVVEVATDLDPRELLERCHALEAAAERTRDTRWGPRTLDVDVLWIDGVECDEHELQVPHPRMRERRFVMAPLAELAPDVAGPNWEASAVGDVRVATEPSPVRTARIIGPGRAGQSLARALERSGIDVELLERASPVERAAHACDIVIIATPDAAIATVAQSIDPVPGTVVAHVAGALGLEVLAPHTRRACLHPMVAMPDGEVGAERLRGAWFAVSGDDTVFDLVRLLEGRAVALAEGDRVAHHAAAVVASNHVVALLGQVERLAAAAHMPFECYLDLVRGAVANVADLGAPDALTGPVARADWDTVAKHLAALDPAERTAYAVMAEQAARLT